MSISTYAELQAAIASFLNRDDLTATIPTFIALAEATHNRSIRHWQMETRAEATFNERYEALPLDWREVIRINVGGQKVLNQLSQTDMMEMREERGNASGEPRFYAISAGQLELFPTPDGDYEGSMIYYADIPRLSDVTTTNWLLQGFPDVYLYGSLIHSAPFLHEDERLAAWSALHQSGLDAVNRESLRAKHGGSGARIKIRSY